MPKKVRVRVWRAAWSSVTGPPSGSRVPTDVLQQMYSPTPTGWSVVDFWNAAGHGAFEFSDAIVDDLDDVGLHLHVAADHSGDVDFATLYAAANNRFSQLKKTFGPNDVVVLFMDNGPTPSHTQQAFNGVRGFSVHDSLGTHSRYCHEFGHALGLPDALGPDLWGNDHALYCDQYCVMSAEVYGYGNAPSDRFPFGIPPLNAPPDLATAVGPLPAAALISQHVPDMQKSPYAVTAPSNFAVTPFDATLRSFSAPGAGPFTVRIPGPSSTIVLEYRTATGWDMGLDAAITPPSIDLETTAGGQGEVRWPVPGVVIHEEKAGEVVMIGRIPVPKQGASDWTHAIEDIAVSVVTGGSSAVHLRIGGRSMLKGTVNFRDDSTEKTLITWSGTALFGSEHGLCHSKRYGYSLSSIAQTHVLVASTTGVHEPDFEWNVQGTVLRGTNLHQTITFDENVAFERTTGNVVELHTCELDAEVDGGVLILKNRPGDGNYQIPITVRPVNSPGLSTTGWVQFIGTSLTIDRQFAEDVVACNRWRLIHIMQVWPPVFPKIPGPGPDPADGSGPDFVTLNSLAPGRIWVDLRPAEEVRLAIVAPRDILTDEDDVGRA
jgi:hypothetical protein